MLFFQSKGFSSKLSTAPNYYSQIPFCFSLLQYVEYTTNSATHITYFG